MRRKMNMYFFANTVKKKCNGNYLMFEEISISM